MINMEVIGQYYTVPHFYEGRSHCALHDHDKETVWADIVVWLDGMVVTAQLTKQQQQLGAAQ